MKNILIILVSIICLDAMAQSPWFFGSGEAVNLTNGIRYNNGVKIITGALNPSSTAVNAPAGSIYASISGTVYIKQDAGSSTNWLPVGVASPGTLATINGQSGPAVSIAAGTSGTDFAVSAAANTVTLNIPSSSAANRGLLTSSDWSTFNNKEPAITATTSADYYRGDKTFATLNKAAVGLGNVDNTTDLNKPISTATQTALDLKITGVGSSVDGEIILFNGTTGGSSKRSTGTGFAKLTSGVLSASSTVNLASEVTGVLPMVNGGTDKNLTPVLGGVVYTDAGSMEVLGAGTSGQVLTSNGASAPTWSNPSSGGTITCSSSTKTTNYTALSTDCLIYLNSVSGVFDITLPASPATNQVLTLVKVNDDTSSNGYINIIGSYEGGSDTVIHTKGEALSIQYNGTTWKKLYRNTNTEWSSPQVLNITATGSAPTPASNATFNRTRWRREGSFAWIYLEYATSGTATSAAAGSGHYKISLPTQLQAQGIDTNFYTLNTSTTATTAINNQIAGSRASGSYGGSNGLIGGVSVYDAGTYRLCGIFAASTLTCWSSSQNSLNQVNASMVAEFPIKIYGWNP